MTPRRQVLGLLAALAVAGVADFAQRVYVGRDDTLRELAPAAPADVPPPPDAVAVRANLAAWLPTLGGGPQQDPAKLTWTVRLVATFVDRPAPFAVIMATPQGGPGAPETHMLRVGAAVHGHTLREIRPGAAVVETPEGVRELTVFERRPPGSP
jgi:hypothetical protein